MTVSTDALILAVCGGLGGMLGIKLRLPVGGLLGAIVGAGGFHLATDTTLVFGTGLRMFTQLIVGTIVGASVSVQVFRTLREILPRALAFCVMVIGTGVLLAWFAMVKLGHVDLLTAFLSTAPAGAMEMGAAALGTYADAEVVLATHILRIVSIGFAGGTLLPFLVRRRDRNPPGTRTAGEGL